MSPREMAGFVLGALATAGVAMLLRTLPWPKEWRAVKPLSCSVCMGLHSALAVLLFCLATGELAVTGVWPGSGLTGADFARLVLRYFAFGAVAALVQSRLFPPPVELPLD